MNNWSRNYLVSNKLVNTYRKLFQDSHPLHTSDKKAKQMGFKMRLVYGNILGGFISNFVGMVLGTHETFLIQQQIIYLKPVYVNDNLSLHVELYKFFPSVNTIEYKFQFYNQHNIIIARGTFQCISK
jgi:3-hydroxybutyryl-CoA dehydratase